MKIIYVAGASKEIDLVEGYVAELRRHGWTISHDWCSEIRSCSVPEGELTDEEQARTAEADLYGVESAEVFWLMVPKNQSVGAWIELGAALSLRRGGLPPVRVIVSGTRGSIFETLADERYATHEEALRALCNEPSADVAGPRPEGP